jgi:hypothetical protein
MANFKSKTLRTPVGTTRYCFLQGEGFTFFPNNDDGASMSAGDREQFIFDNAYFKTEIVFEGADAEQIKAQIDEAVSELVDDKQGCAGSDLKHPPYIVQEDGSLLVKTKVKVNGKKRDGERFTRKVVLLDAKDGKPFEGDVGSGSKVQLALTAKGWAGFGTVGLSLQPKAVLVHEAHQGGARRDDAEYWGDFFDVNGEPAAGGEASTGDF